MLQVSDTEIQNRLAFDNPWWESGEGIDAQTRDYPRRAYFDPFYALVTRTDVRRAIILLGPRRVGKTVMLKQTVQRLVDEGHEHRAICYVSIDNPTYAGLSLEKLLRLLMEVHDHRRTTKLFIIFDEIQYLKDWEIHLKSLVDSYPAMQFVGSGSAAVALRLKSRESGAGRFSEFLLPPLMFSEYLRFIGKEADAFSIETRRPKSIELMNDEFQKYLNFGGLPEAVHSDSVQRNMERYVRDDIIDKVLLRDLPSLYGIGDTQELNRLFAMLAYNTGGEVSLEGLSQSSGIAKNTIRRHLDYLEAAFLIRRIHRVDERARAFKRITAFKVYLTNPCLRTALFGPVAPDDEAMGRLAESALTSQWMHSDLFADMRYSRWRDGEIDLVSLDRATQTPELAVEVKWSDRPAQRVDEAAGLVSFCKRNGLNHAFITTRTRSSRYDIDGVRIFCEPLAFWCYKIDRDIIERDLDSGRHPGIESLLLP